MKPDIPTCANECRHKDKVCGTKPIRRTEDSVSVVKVPKIRVVEVPKIRGPSGRRTEDSYDHSAYFSMR